MKRIVRVSVLIICFLALEKGLFSQLPVALNLCKAWSSPQETRTVLQQLFCNQQEEQDGKLQLDDLPDEIINHLLLMHLACASSYREAAVTLSKCAQVSLRFREVVCEFIRNIYIYYPAALEIEDNDKNLLIHAAALEGCYLIVAELLNAGVNPNVQTSKGFTALHLAAIRGNRDIVTLLVSSNADVTLKAAAGFTALHYAVSGNALECMHTLLIAGSNVNEVDNKGWSSLHLAAIRGYDRAVARLLQYPGIIVDARTRKGLTPLHCAARKGFLRVARLLLLAGADKGAANKYGERPVNFVDRRRFAHLARLLS